jgi:23S rRNA (adenine-N6)-dimethyltransferase
VSAARSAPGARSRSRSRPAAPPARWGWHRLQPDAARHVVRRAGVEPGDLVVDLGAGRGALTAALVDAGAHVVAVEIHPGRLADLRVRFAGRPVTVVAADIDGLRLPRRAFRVVANPPWARAETVRAALLRAPALVRADLVLPRWLVHRWADGSPRIEIGCSLRAESFTPPAPTGSAVAVVHGRRR